MVQPLWKTVWRLLKRLRIELPYDPVVPRVEHSEKNESSNLKRHTHPNAHSSIIYNSQDIKVTKVSISK